MYNLEAFHKLNIVLLCGLYGAGKTEFALKYFRGKGRDRISRSEIRRLIYEMTRFGEQWTADRFLEEDDFLVKHIERRVCEHYLQNKRNILVVNTFMSKLSRARFVTMAREMKKTIGVLFLDTPLEICLAQSARHDLGVTRHVIQKLDRAKELPSRTEGFGELLVIGDFKAFE